MRRLITILTALLLALGLPAVAAADPADTDTETGSLTIALLPGPDGPGEDPRSANYITDHLAPGDRIERRVVVTNHTGAEAQVDVYAGAAALRDGEFTIANRGEGNELTDWVRIDQETVQLADGQSAEIAVDITVPDDAPEGEQYAVIWAEADAGEDAGGEVQIVSRVGVRMYVSVGPGGAPPADFALGALTAGRDADGHATVTAEVTNTGGRAVDLSGELTLTDGPGGLSAAAVTAETTTLAPGQSAPMVFTLPDSQTLPAGPWLADAVVASGRISQAADGQVTFPGADAADTEDGGLAPWAWVLIVIAVIVVVAGGGYTLQRRTTGTGRSER